MVRGGVPGGEQVSDIETCRDAWGATVQYRIADGNILMQQGKHPWDDTHDVSLNAFNAEEFEALARLRRAHPLETGRPRE